MFSSALSPAYAGALPVGEPFCYSRTTLSVTISKGFSRREISLLSPSSRPVSDSSMEDSYTFAAKGNFNVPAAWVRRLSYRRRMISSD